MFKTTVDGQGFEIAPDGDQWLVNGEPLEWDLTLLGNGHYHILYRNRGFRTEIVGIDRESKVVNLKINGNRYAVQVRDKFDILLEKMGMNNASAGKVNVIKAPMPGLIIDLRVQAGDHVKAGDPLLVLEAMKMENIIKAPGEGIVRNLKVKKGDTVEKGQLLIEF